MRWMTVSSLVGTLILALFFALSAGRSSFLSELDWWRVPIFWSQKEDMNSYPIMVVHNPFLEIL